MFFMSKPMRHFVCTLVIVMLIGPSLAGTDDHLPVTATQSAGLNQDPEAAKLITSDIPNFWRVFDKALLITAGDLDAETFLRESGYVGRSQ
jgi:hypothetical protein